MVVWEVRQFVQARSAIRATGRPSSCAFEGRHAPRSPDPRTNDESPSPQKRPDAARGPKQRREHQPSKPLAWKEKLSRPRSPASTPRVDVPPEQRSWSLNLSWLQFNAGPTPGTCHWLQLNAGPSGRNMPLIAIQYRPVRQEHATGCNSMQDPPPVGLHRAVQVRHVHSVKKRRPPQQTATRASCHEVRHNRRSLPHPRWRVSSGGALLSSV